MMNPNDQVPQQVKQGLMQIPQQPKAALPAQPARPQQPLDAAQIKQNVNQPNQDAMAAAAKYNAYVMMQARDEKTTDQRLIDLWKRSQFLSDSAKKELEKALAKRGLI